MAEDAKKPDESKDPVTKRLVMLKAVGDLEVGKTYDIDEETANFYLKKEFGKLYVEEKSFADTVAEEVEKVKKAFEETILEANKAKAELEAKSKEINAGLGHVAKGLKISATAKDHEEEARFGFKNCSHFLRDVMEAGKKHGKHSEILSKYISTKAPTGLNTYSDSDGGFLVPDVFSSGLLERMYEVSPFSSRAMRMTTGGNSLRINGVDETSRANGSRIGGVRAYWESEADQHTNSKPKFRQIQMNLHKVSCFGYMTEEMAEDANFDLESWWMGKMIEETEFKVNDAILNGEGTGLPLGILKCPALVTVSAETDQAASTIVFENILKMWQRMYSKSRPSAVWFINQDIEHQLYSLSHAVGLGGVPVYLPANGLAGSPFATLFGRPVVPTEYNATLGTVGDIVLADMSQYALLTKANGGVKTAMSMHLRFDYDELAFRATFRVDGQPLWQDALTPFKGSNTQSPFVALATRS